MGWVLFGTFTQDADSEDVVNDKPEQISPAKERRLRRFFRSFRRKGDGSLVVSSVLSDTENNNEDLLDKESIPDVCSSDDGAVLESPPDAEALDAEKSNEEPQRYPSRFRNLFSARSAGTATPRNPTERRTSRFYTFFRRSYSPTTVLSQIDEVVTESARSPVFTPHLAPVAERTRVRERFRQAARKTKTKTRGVLQSFRSVTPRGSKYMADSMKEWAKFPLGVLRSLFAIEEAKRAAGHTLTYWLRMLGAVLINECDFEVQTQIRGVCEKTGLLDMALAVLSREEGQSCRATAVLCNTVLLYLSTSGCVLDCFSEKVVPETMLTNLKTHMDTAQDEHDCIFDRPANLQSLAISFFRVVVLSGDRPELLRKWYDLGVLSLAIDMMLSFSDCALVNELGACLLGRLVDQEYATNEEVEQMLRMVPVRLSHTKSSVMCFQQMFYVLHKASRRLPNLAREIFCEPTFIPNAKKCVCRVLAVRTRDTKCLQDVYAALLHYMNAMSLAGADETVLRLLSANSVDEVADVALRVATRNIINDRFQVAFSKEILIPAAVKLKHLVRPETQQAADVQTSFLDALLDGSKTTLHDMTAVAA